MARHLRPPCSIYTTSMLIIIHETEILPFETLKFWGIRAPGMPGDLIAYQCPSQQLVLLHWLTSSFMHMPDSLWSADRRCCEMDHIRFISTSLYCLDWLHRQWSRSGSSDLPVNTNGEVEQRGKWRTMTRLSICRFKPLLSCPKAASLLPWFLLRNQAAGWHAQWGPEYHRLAFARVKQFHKFSIFTQLIKVLPQNKCAGNYTVKTARNPKYDWGEEAFVEGYEKK